MSQPVKLSDELVLDARVAGKAQERSIAGQVEFWAKLGRATEVLLGGRKLMALQMSAGAQPLSEALASVEKPEGRKRVADVLANRPYPHYRQYPDEPGLLVRLEEDGTETVGRFVNRTFVSVKVNAGPKRQPVPELRTKTVERRVKSKSASTGAAAKSGIRRKKLATWA